MGVVGISIETVAPSGPYGRCRRPLQLSEISTWPAPFSRVHLETASLRDYDYGGTGQTVCGCGMRGIIPDVSGALRSSSMEPSLRRRGVLSTFSRLPSQESSASETLPFLRRELRCAHAHIAETICKDPKAGKGLHVLSL